MRVLPFIRLSCLLSFAMAHPQPKENRVIATSNGTLAFFECGTDKSDAAPELLAANEMLAKYGPFKGNASLYRRDSSNIVISTYMHLVYSSSKTTSISDQQWQSQFAAINQAYKGSGFAYRLIGLTKTVNDSWAFGNNRSDMENTLRRGAYGTINLYFLTDLGGGIIGQCSMPYYIGVNPPASSYAADGCVIHAGTMPGGTFADYNQGKTAVHEIGHWMGLFHTFEGYSCRGTGDYIADTPAQSTSTNGCPAGKDSCPSDPGLDLIHNYMDYSTDPCYTSFTTGQTQRMNNLWSMYRNGK
jgi:hypothetical protein